MKTQKITNKFKGRNEILMITVKILFLFVIGASATPSNLDPTFGAGGIIDNATYVTTQSDGKIVTLNSFQNVTSRFLVKRYNPDGSSDITFGDGGSTQIDFSENVDFPEIPKKIAIDRDGKIVVAGSSGSTIDTRVLVGRLNTDGTLDTTFDTDGKSMVNIYGSVNSMAVQPDGKIVVVGSTISTANLADSMLIRLNNDGLLDTTFRVTGVVVDSLNSSNDFARAVRIRPDGKIVILSATNEQNFIIAVYDSNGILDPTFGVNGIVTEIISTDVSNFVSGGLYNLAIQNDGKIVAVGWINALGPSNGFAVIRYNSNGTRDTTFGTNGRVRTYGRETAFAVEIQNDGKIIVAGLYQRSLNFRGGAIIRLNSDGSPDRLWNGGNTQRFDFSLGNEFYDLSLDNQGRIFASGIKLMCFQGNDAILTTSLNGVVTNANGRGISKVTLRLSDGYNFSIRTIMTDAMGRFSFDNLGYGGYYFINPSHRYYKFQFNPPPVQVVSDSVRVRITASQLNKYESEK